MSPCAEQRRVHQFFHHLGADSISREHIYFIISTPPKKNLPQTRGGGRIYYYKYNLD